MFNKLLLISDMCFEASKPGLKLSITIITRNTIPMFYNRENFERHVNGIPISSVESGQTNKMYMSHDLPIVIFDMLNSVT